MADYDPNGYMPRPNAPQTGALIPDEGKPFVEQPPAIQRKLCPGCGAELTAELDEVLPEYCNPCFSGETAAQRAKDLEKRKKDAIAKLGPDGLPRK